MKLLKESGNIIQTVLDIVQNCECLVVKGTAFNVSNVFSQTETGLQVLADNNWNVYNLRKGDHIGGQFLCLPQNQKNLFELKVLDESNPFILTQKIDKKNIHDLTHFFWQSQSQYWAVYTRIINTQVPTLKDYEQEFLKHLSELNKFNSDKKTSQSMRTIMDNHVDIFNNAKIYYHILLYLTYFKWKGVPRSKILGVLDLFYRTGHSFLFLIDEEKGYDDFVHFELNKYENFNGSETGVKF
jgi:hypothetical protein